MRQFQLVSAITARWQAWEGPASSLEHLDLRRDGEGIVACGVVIASAEPAHFGLRYRLLIDRSWRVRDALLETTAGESLHLESDGMGQWKQNGTLSPSLNGCIDIDIEATPFTNTLPIRRLSLEAGESRLVRLAYIRVPALAVAPGEQRYTAIHPGALYRFESLDHAFTAELPVDPHGLVRDYPGLFRRLL
ncbi:putative glycolipid-binding domain-containing protein [Microvirga brassicacearum]|uniref:Transcriptional regulator n=1 Tax=Microvirga brassicacearum TaxID=2580413 RepID=A0A5N3P3I1_9HYPH|nr:putative glycolipid-binding domain-containing protein [Microvirga brassicacearum]KAB0264283.1 transcriptional regulator [Microvirga brassicacearum]